MTDAARPPSLARRRACAPLTALGCAALGWALVGWALVGCAPPPPPEGGARFPDVAAAAAVLGHWRWSHEAVVDGTRRREDERWLLERDGLTRVRGSYTRQVTIEATDGTVFACNQRPSYRQDARFAVAGTVEPDGVQLTEVDYQARPSPCEPGLRRTGHYHAHREHGGLILVGDDSVSRLVPDLEPAPPWPEPATTLAGPWSWSAVSWTADGLVQHEAERWQLLVDGGELSGSYQRTVTLTEPSGRALPCAGAPGYTFVDRYAVRGRRVADEWRLQEDEVEAGAHPCLAGTPTRTLDAATAALEGEYLVLTWRGPRRQVLARPLAPPTRRW